MSTTTTSTITTATSLPFMRRRSSAALSPILCLEPLVEADATAHATLAVAIAVGGEMTESLLSFDIDDERLEEEEYLKHDLPESILPMSPEPSPRGRSASALSTAAIETAAAALTSWFTTDDFVNEDDAMDDEAVNEMDEDFLRDDYMKCAPVQQHEEEETMPTPEKLSLIAEEDFAQTVASVQPWATKAFAWPWVRAN